MLPYGTRFDRRQPFVEQVGLAYVRGCEVQGMLDDKGRVIEEGKQAPPTLSPLPGTVTEQCISFHIAGLALSATVFG